MNKRITKQRLLEQVTEAMVSMDMDTYKKEKNSLDKDDNVIIRDNDEQITEETEETEQPKSDIYEQFIRIVNK